MLGAYALGFDSAIATTLNVFPQIGRDLLDQTINENYSGCKELQELLTNIVIVITKYGKFKQYNTNIYNIILSNHMCKQCLDYNLNIFTS